jgi:LmbE family N-acetylglucosaminyl deacetylase
MHTSTVVAERDTMAVITRHTQMMPTLVCFHAHPDDEALSTGGTIARAAAQGNRVVLVVATGGEHGEVPDGLADGETLADRRRAEVERSSQALGVARVEWLDYRDSGMTGWEQNAHPDAFMNAPLDEAGERLAVILRAESADVLTTYDWHGNYGHPDHVAVHRVGHRAAELAGTANVYEATVNRDALRRFMDTAKEHGLDVPDFGDDANPQTDDGNPFGMPESDLTTFVDVSEFVGAKRASMKAHASQISDTSFFLQMPDEVFAALFGTEWFIRKGAAPDTNETWLTGLS